MRCDVRGFAVNWPIRASWADNQGSAPVEFVFVGGLTTLLTLATVQLAFSLYVHNTTLDAAREGARYGILEGNSPRDAELRTRELLTTAVGALCSDNVRADAGASDDLFRLHVSVACPVTAIGPFLPLLTKTLEATATRPLTAAERAQAPS